MNLLHPASLLVAPPSRVPCSLNTGMVVAVTVRDTDLEAALAAVQSVRA